MKDSKFWIHYTPVSIVLRENLKTDLLMGVKQLSISTLVAKWLVGGYLGYMIFPAHSLINLVLYGRGGSCQEARVHVPPN